jgi:hypothetical protein
MSQKIGLVSQLEGKKPFEGPRLTWVNLNLSKDGLWDVDVWSRFSWLRTGSNSGPASSCKHGNGFYVYTKHEIC